ncbi:SusC/RagA family TonB-linked outer membrane protein [Bacteroidia bacterium]|nr:SusC/RagA family TonB-linked outer membrane protein [Bacteroidia bacterium]
MAKILKNIVIAIIFANLVPAFAQNNVKITGKVIDDNTREPIIGAGITVVNTKTGAITDVSGFFTLSVNALPATISVNYLGYKRQEIDVYEVSEPLEIVLSEDRNILNEVVVTGYTSQRRKEISGAISSIKISESIAGQPDPDITKLLQGKVSGVNVLSSNGTPGGGISFIVRGNNSINGSVEPLYVVDGVFLNPVRAVSNIGGTLGSNPLADLNPADIEEISILKDANATAIYGAQGSNGVVIITTKRGKINTQSKVSFTVSHGWADSPNKFELTNGPETGMLLNEAWANTASDLKQTLPEWLDRNKPQGYNLIYPYKTVDASGKEVIDYTRPGYDILPTYDKVKDIFQTAQLSDYQVAIQGGNATSTHYIGLGYTDQETVVKPTTFNRFSLRVNYDNKITSKLKIGTNFNLGRTLRGKVYSNDSAAGGVINAAIFPRSYLPNYNEDGSYAKHGTFESQLALVEHIDNQYATWRSTINLFGEYAFLPELKFRSSWNLDYIFNTVNSFSDFALSTSGSARANNLLDLLYTAEQLLTYAKELGPEKRHHLSVFLGNTVNVRKNASVEASASSYVTDIVREVNAGGTSSGSATSSESRLLSYFGKATYTLDNKYTLDFSFRADGSSRVGKHWGYFPAAGATWNAGQESFISDKKIFDALKFRGSFGYSGNQNGINDYASLGLWSVGSSYLGASGLTPSRLANPNLTWESTRQIDLGTEFSILNNRLNINLDVYHKYTYNMLLNLPIPSRSGFSTITDNFGEISNRGIEFDLESVNISKKTFKWTTNFNISANRNRVEKLSGDILRGASGRNTSILREGYPVNSYYLYKQLYVDPQTGNAVYDDVNDDNEITIADRQIVAKAAPDFTGGITNNLTYKNWDFTAFFYFSEGNNILNMRDFFLVHGGTQSNIGYVKHQLDRWQNSGDITDIPRQTLYNGNPQLNGDQPGSGANNYRGNVANLSSRYVEDASYIRLKNIALGYTLPKAWVSRWKIDRVKATVAASNVWTCTKYTGLDPEVSAQSADQNTAGYDWATVPQPRTIQLILNATF